MKPKLLAFSIEIRLEEATAQTAVPREAVQSLSATQATSDTSDAFKESPNQVRPFSIPDTIHIHSSRL